LSFYGLKEKKEKSYTSQKEETMMLKGAGIEGSCLLNFLLFLGGFCVRRALKHFPHPPEATSRKQSRGYIEKRRRKTRMCCI
jgi:hypothetical protein